MNTVVLVGRIVANPEVKFISNGTAVCDFTLAVDRRYKSNGETPTDFINCVAWRNQAELLSKYVSKGNRIAIEGDLRMEKYNTKEGEQRTTFRVNVNNIDLIEPKKENNQG